MGENKDTDDSCKTTADDMRVQSFIINSSGWPCLSANFRTALTFCFGFWGIQTLQSVIV